MTQMSATTARSQSGLSNSECRYSLRRSDSRCSVHIVPMITTPTALPGPIVSSDHAFLTPHSRLGK